MDDVAATPRSLKHVAVREYVRSLVEGADAGSPAPSERELVQRFGVARMTVRQAMDALVSEGLLERMPGRGTFVARPRRRVGRLTSFTEEMERRGMLAESQTLLARREQAGPGVAKALGITPGDAVIHWKRLRRADGAADVHRGRLPQRGAAARASSRRRCRPACTTRSTRAACARPGPRTRSPPTSPPPRRPTLLQIKEGEPGAPVGPPRARGEKPVEVSRSAYRADRFTLWVQLGQESSSRPSSATAVPLSSQTHTGSGPPRSGWM